MMTEDVQRLEVVQKLAKFLDLNSVGTASIWTCYYVLRKLLAGEKPAVSNRMHLIKYLKEKNPALLKELEPYFDPDCDLLKGMKPSLVSLGKGQVSW